MYLDNKILIGRSGEEDICIYPAMANRHGLIAGATGTGKTVTLKVMAESFSDCGVPVFLADAKGDLAGVCKSGLMDENLQGRIARLGLAETGFPFKAYPAVFWDLYQERGLPLRTTVSEIGPLLLSRILDLNETQSDILTLLFKIADDEGLLLTDIRDLKALIRFVGENIKDYALNYGHIAPQSLAAVTRSVVALEAEGGELFFSEPGLDLRDWICLDPNGHGMINILDCQKLMMNPTMYSTFLLWMISELFELLPEMGDCPKPRMVFFFDEAHMLFKDAPKALLSKIEQLVKLIRSKGVGIYFITQNPADIPDPVLAQLGNKVQHALHAYTPKEQRSAKAAADSFRVNPAFDTYQELISLGIGEALVSVLDESGVPTMVKKTLILPPQSQMGTLDEASRQQIIQMSPLYIKYKDATDPESAYELLARISAEREQAEQEAKEALAAQKQAEKEEREALKAAEKAAEAARRQEEKAAKEAERAAEKAAAAAEKERLAKERQLKSEVGKIAGTAAGTIGREIGNSLGKTVGGTFGKRLGGNLGASLGRGLMSTLFKK